MSHQLDGYWTRRRSRRSLLASSAIGTAGLAAGLVVGCGDDDDDDGGGVVEGTPTPVTGPTETPKRGGTWRYYTDIAREPHNPTVSVNTASSIWGAISDTALTSHPQTAAIEPVLIEKWEQVSPSELLLKVRPNVRWQNRPPVNGRAVTADDIAHALLMHAGKLDTSNTVNYPRKGSFAGVDKIQAVDASTVRITMSSPTNALIPNIADYRISMFPKEQGDIGFKEPNKFVGSGPWMMSPGYQDDQDLSTPYRMTRNPDYWRQGLPNIDELRASAIQDPAARQAAFLAGEIDTFSTLRTPQVELEALLRQAPSGTQSFAWEFPQWLYTAFNTQKDPWKDPKVRRAIFLALNHGQMANSFYGSKRWSYTGPLAYTFYEHALQPAEIRKMPGWNPDTKNQDIAEAKKLMSAAGHEDGALNITDLVFALAMNSQNALRLKDQLESVWPKMKVTIDEKADSATFYAKTAELTFDFQAASIFAVPSPVSELTNHYHSAGGRNYGKYSNRDVDSALTAALAEFDNAALKTKLVDIQKKLIEEMPIMVHYVGFLSAMYGKNVRGLERAHGPFRSGSQLELLWLDQG